MNKLLKILFVIFVMGAFFASTYVVPKVLKFGDGVSIVEAAKGDKKAKKKKKKKKKKKGDVPPTVSELPIQYMLPGGVAIILLLGAGYTILRKRHQHPPPKA